MSNRKHISQMKQKKRKNVDLSSFIFCSKLDLEKLAEFRGNIFNSLSTLCEVHVHTFSFNPLTYETTFLGVLIC